MSELFNNTYSYLPTKYTYDGLSQPNFNSGQLGSTGLSNYFYKNSENPYDSLQNIYSRIINDISSYNKSNPTNVYETYTAPTKGWSKNYTSDIDNMVIDVAKSYNVPPEIVKGIIWHESRGDSNAKNPYSTASGLTQLTKATADFAKVNDVFDPRQNVTGATKLLSGYYKKYKNWDDAIRAYAWGTGATDAWIKNNRNLEGLNSRIASHFDTGQDLVDFFNKTGKWS